MSLPQTVIAPDPPEIIPSAQADSPELVRRLLVALQARLHEAGHLGEMVRAIGLSVDGYARLAVLSARQAADAASRITDDIPGADNSDELREVVQASAATLAACLRATRSEERAISAAIEAADWLTTIR
jgi:hypothetical protein